MDRFHLLPRRGHIHFRHQRDVPPFRYFRSTGAELWAEHCVSEANNPHQGVPVLAEEFLHSAGDVVTRAGRAVGGEH